MIKVLQMIGSLDVGGSQTMIMNIYRNIDRTKMQFDFVLDHPNQTYFAEELKAMGANIYTMPGFNGINVCEIKRAWDNFFCTHPEYKILHSHVRSYATLYLPVAKKHGVKTIIHSHAMYNGYSITAFAKSMLQKPLRRQADILMACSTESGVWLYGKRALKKDNYIYFPNAVDTQRFSFNEQTRRKYRQDLGIQGKLVVGHVGRFSKVKNHDFLLDAFALLHRDIPNSTLLLVGDGELRADISRKAVSLGIAENVLLVGNRDDVPGLLSAMDVFAFPSFSEGLGISIIEAQVSGLPCLISDTIPSDVDVSPLVHRLPIGDAQLWADEMKKSDGRQDVTEYILRAGYDIRASANELTALYTRLWEESGRAIKTRG